MTLLCLDLTIECYHKIVVTDSHLEVFQLRWNLKCLSYADAFESKRKRSNSQCIWSERCVAQAQRAPEGRQDYTLYTIHDTMHYTLYTIPYTVTDANTYTVIP